VLFIYKQLYCFYTENAGVAKNAHDSDLFSRGAKVSGHKQVPLEGLSSYRATLELRVGSKNTATGAGRKTYF
jgi:hypothetical protein